MSTAERRVWIYRRADGPEPFLHWLGSLRDSRAKQKIQARIGRVRLGNLGHARSVGEGVHELKIDYGPGYRVYFGLNGPQIHLLLGGSKQGQSTNIRLAKKFWNARSKSRIDSSTG